MRMKNFSYLLSAVLMLSLVPVRAFAGEMDMDHAMKVEDDDQKEDTILTPVETDDPGSITIKLEDHAPGVPKGGVSLAVVRVAEVENGAFVLTEAFADTNVNLNQIDTVEELEKAADKLQAQAKKQIPKQQTVLTTDDSGKASISDLLAGVYLIYATDTAQYGQIMSALFSIPTFDEEAGVMDYDIEIFPKHVPVPEKKISTPVKTGVEDHVMAYAGVLIFSSAAAVFILIKAAKKKQQTK